MRVMAVEREAHLEQFFRRRVKLIGGYSIKLAPTEAGIPDRLVFFPGRRMFLVELKAEDGAVSAIQHVWHSRIRAYGVNVHVVTGRAGILRWLKDRVDEAGPEDELQDVLDDLL